MTMDNVRRAGISDGMVVDLFAFEATLRTSPSSGQALHLISAPPP